MKDCNIFMNILKKLLYICLIIFLTVPIFPDSALIKSMATISGFDTVTIDGIKYEVKDYKAHVIGVTNKNITKLTIPKTIEINNKTIYVRENYLDIKELKNLTYIKMPYSLVFYNEFSNLNNLEEITFTTGGNINKINGNIINTDMASLSSCTNLKRIRFEGGIEGIAKETFKGLKNITTIYIPESLKTIGVSAFEDCTNLEYVITNYSNDTDGISIIANSAFSGCSKLKINFLRNNIKAIGNYAFYNCGGRKHMD